jgi:hypothetical protein
MVLKISEDQHMSLSSTGRTIVEIVQPLLQHSHVKTYEATSMFFGREWLIHLQGNDSNTFLHRTLTKSSNKSMLNDQASLMTL